MAGGLRTQVALLACFAVALFAISRFVPPYWVSLLTEALIWAILALSLDILLGHTGLPSLGHAAFYGMGGYAAAICFLHFDQSFWMCLAAGVGAAALLALAFGLLVLRTTAVFFLMITLALAQVLWGIAYTWRSVTGGDDGLRGIKRDAIELGPLQFALTGDYFVFVLLVFVLAALLMLVIMRSPFGYALRGIRESSERMGALGYDVWRYKFIAFVVAGAFGGLAGALFVFNKNYVSPEALSVVVSAEVMLMVILGGAGTLFGPIIGALVIVFLSYWVSGLTERWNLVLGIIYILVVVLAPNGLTGLAQRWRRAPAEQPR
ncbi:MAG: branched-chain amino acid ABC transporter permease [Burkholderiales bacterium]|nr:branched-chain amino acid ABC transporter permease [Burkholderiales bacterium]